MKGGDGGEPAGKPDSKPALQQALTSNDAWRHARMSARSKTLISLVEGSYFIHDLRNVDFTTTGKTGHTIPFMTANFISLDDALIRPHGSSVDVIAVVVHVGPLDNHIHFPHGFN
ncbi:hypothetical protein EJB05_08657 [Eragrostis curvula]|uniref:Uncharacterized protein n=1 Tax=Eragrostis curvula TaxID=38414 RepID=A0A5J9W2X1_9POAL|nr:hypothetical protein EJB05_08657 [Eragrostis curvula]